MRQSRFQDKPEKKKQIQSFKRLNLSKQQTLEIKQIEFQNGIYQGLSNQNNERQGIGIYIWDGGEIYFGEWKHDKIDGQGILFFPQGGFIHGFFFKNKLNGPVFLKYANGDIYEGIWHHGKIEGQCYKYFTDENQIFQYLNSPNEILQKYTINIQQLKFNDGGQYIGFIKNGVPNGIGIMKYADGKYDCGFYKNGSLNGLGRINLHNGNIYDGYVKDGFFQGLGLFFQKETGSWIYGNFEKNQCSNIIKKGQGEFPLQIIGNFIFLLQQFKLQKKNQDTNIIRKTKSFLIKKLLQNFIKSQFIHKQIL
ncbi:morm repeat family protein [Ichthyophthirius multifiliis]|uniref:Morm repeat family protein n=1 Tax=Ichthyophthirius multifiliis TaxID=5932 RepID=G0QZV4_ICHMU|nr:morm repeat family protein [Ichthyophthirius multifiliis]EGR29249.1 morm repeat family protein [Ichthyophthirius multifiliis]|eukprot:XP_004030485.1 morm repeat family protein [Ichthyophthirius multifiliis]